MLKIFLVEDEVIVREGIKKKVKWEEYGFTFVGEASDGELAFPLIQEAQPDVIITDIRMPFMDGLELARLVRQEMPWVKIIILSGYDEFQYAKEAISIGVTDYLLKPVSSAMIVETIQRVKAIIEEEREQKDYLQQFQMDMEEHERLERRRFFEDLVTKKQTTAEILDHARQLGLELVASGYRILLFSFSGEADAADAYSERIIGLQQQVEELVSAKKDAVLFKRDLDGYALLLKGETEQNARYYAEKLSKALGGEEGIQYFIGVGMPVQRLTEISKAFETASKAFAYRYLLDQNRTVFYGELQGIPALQEDSASLKNLDTTKLDKGVVERFLKSGTAENAAHFIADYFESWGSEHIRSLLFRQYIAMDIHLASATFLEELGVGKAALFERCGDIDQIGERLGTVEGTAEYLRIVLSETLRLRDQASSQRYSALLEEARAYIFQNYANEEISLNHAARAVNLSPTHFSAIFSQEMGKTFVEYLTAVRMEKAKELLRCSGMKSSEIAYAVGYKDPHYFSYLFKKLQGCTPKDFRTGKAAEE